jgi:hypothetical protein
VRYRAAGDARNATLCHCGSCRHAAGAPVVAWVTFPRAGFSFTGAAPVRYRSSPPVVRTFCGRCGTPISYERDDEPEMVDVTVISLDRADEFPPEDQIWTSDSLAWFERAGALPRYRGKRGTGDE